MNEKRPWGLLLLGVLLAGCAASEPSLRELELPGATCQEAEREVADTCLTVLCDEEVCGFFRCEDVAEAMAVSEGAEVAPGGVVKVLDMQGLGLHPPGYSGSPMRYWGRPLPLQREQGAVFIIPWRNHHLRNLLPSQKQLIEEANRKLNRPHEKHHIFPQEFKEWFKGKGIDIHQWTMWLETGQHQSIHRGPSGGPWNAAWRQFKRANEQTATKEEIWKHAWELCVRFGLTAPLQPYHGKTQQPPPCRSEEKMRFYWLDCVSYESLRYTGEYRAERRWGLPGLHCPTCGGDCVGAEVYPSVDLSGLPEATQLERAWQETDLEKFERLRQLVKPLAPAWARLAPGARFGPLIGSAHGRFAQLHTLDGDTVLIRREALEQLHTEGLRALKGVRTGLRFRQRNAPELLELEVEMHGLFHPDCLPPGKAEPCGTCGCYGFSLPKQPLLDRASLPEHLDVFRLRNFTTVIVITERFADTLRRLGFEEFSLRELPVR